MALEGDLRLFQLADMVQVLALQEKTGILTVQGEQDIIAVSFLRGSVVAADALNQTIEEGLGQVLGSAGLVRADQFAAIVAEHQAGGERLVDLLLERGAVERPQLLTALREQAYRLVLQALRWQEGEFKFYAGEEVSFEEGLEPLTVSEILDRAATDLGAELVAAGGAPPVPGQPLEQARPGSPIRVLGGESEGPETDPAAVWVTVDDARTLEAVDGRASVEELARRLGMAEPLARFSFLRLARAGLVRPAAGAGPPAVPPPAPPVSPAPAPPTESAAPPAPLLPAIETPAAALPAPRVDRGAALTWGWRAVAGLLTLALGVALWRDPRLAALPFPWQQESREQVERLQRAALVLGIDRAARAHFLLEGRYPDRLAALGVLGLLGGALRDPSGAAWEVVPGPVSYTLRPRGESGDELAITEGITGDFLLDPEFAGREPELTERPLVLLD